MNPSVTTVYEEYIWRGKYPRLAKKLYSSPPKKLIDISERIPALLQKYRETGWYSDERNKKLKRVLMRVNQEVGTLTPKVRRNIESLHHGAIESAHQTVVMGGPSFILNKAATAERIAAITSTHDYQLASFFCVADYDIVQNELTHIRTPLMGSGGTIVTIPIPKGFEYSPVSVLPLPEYQWLEQVEEDIRSGYRALFKVLEGSSRRLFEERLENILTIIRKCFINTKTLGGWATKILANLFNLEGNLGIPILPASDPEIRNLWAHGMEMLLQKDVRERFIRVHNESTDIILENGFATGIGKRNHHYSPFFYECENETCFKSRTELRYDEQGTTAMLSGKCPTCGENIEIEISTSSPDLSQVAVNLSPRVDTRQLIIDTTIPVVAHAGGPGETAYYAQVIPIAEELGFPFPIYVKYPRVFFNTPWNESLGKTLREKEYPVLHNPEMFKTMGRISRYRKKKRYHEMNEELGSLATIITDTYRLLNHNLQELSERIDNSEEPVEADLMLKLELERYLSWVYGKYAPGKKAQEASWAWVEWAVNAGVPDLFGPYLRAYVPEMNNGATLFVNFSI